MFFWEKKITNDNEQDKLGAYPKRMQISAIPERRYLKTSRILAIVTFLLFGLILAQAGIFVYLVSRLDISLENNRAINIYMIDTEHKVIKPSEHKHVTLSAENLMMEKTLRNYIINRHTVLWDKEQQARIWGEGGPIHTYSTVDSYKKFTTEASKIINSLQAQKAIRDVHLYSFQQNPSGIWEGLFDVFTLPAPDMFTEVCPCSENTRECINCKKENALSHERYKVFIRADFSAKKHRGNPLGIMIKQYTTMYQVIDPDEKVWNLPPVLRPEL